VTRAANRIASARAVLLRVLPGIVLALGGCGQKGPLYLPEKKPAAVTAPATAPAPAPQSSQPQSQSQSQSPQPQPQPQPQKSDPDKDSDATSPPQ